MSEDQSTIPWDELEGGYRVRYDPRPAIAALAAGNGDWSELWEELHHQGDVGLASYAAVPLIADLVDQAPSPDWNAFALAATIEEARTSGERNPELPQWLAADYRAAWERLFAAAYRLFPEASEESLVASLFAVLALGKSRPLLARLAMESEAECAEMFEARPRDRASPAAG